MEILPKQIFVVIEHDREPEDDFLIATENLQDVSLSGEPGDVGVYELVKTMRVENVNQVVGEQNERTD